MAAYIVLIIIVLLGCFKTKNIVVNIIQCFVVWTLFAFSQDEYDYTVYEREYDAVQRGFGSDYEIGYVWLNDICAALGLTYVEFRAVVGLIFCVALAIIVRKLTRHPNVVWSSFIIFSAMSDACLLRNSLAMVVGMVAILFIMRARTILDYLYAIGLVVGAALFHSAYWVLMLFIPLWYLVSKKSVVWVLAGVACIYIVCISNEELLFRVYGSLLIREETIEKYMTGDYANIVGVLYDVCKYLLIISPALYYSRRLPKGDAVGMISQQESARVLFDKNIVRLNIVFSIILVPQFFAVNFSRLFRMLVVFNYIFMANQIGNTRKWINPKFYSLIYACVLLLLMLFWESPTALNEVFFMHFNTNSFLNLF